MSNNDDWVCLSCVKCLDLVDIIIIITILVLLYVAIKTESYDRTCPEGPLTTDISLCREGNGKAYNQAIPQDDDTPEMIKLRILRGAESLVKHVRWRMIYIGAVIIAFLVTALILPCWNWKHLMLILILSFVVMYGISNFNDFHHYNHVKA